MESMGALEIFTGGSHGAVRRAIVVGNGCAGTKNQCLGLADSLMLYVSPVSPIIFVAACDEDKRWFMEAMQANTIDVVKRMKEIS
ncbi:hypothetical protein E2562_024216 [Oryza meyeriana var. granulata]|uniref:Uncharacterized protein n=1 Tax=Oryza meyeriana var. granulata TaxID=110450 RepID=A0A6G1BZQ9_9ORYZ|nr:hypothetical protein E2562_024216 [Oryza meyeriana var. granulata]